MAKTVATFGRMIDRGVVREIEGPVRLLPQVESLLGRSSVKLVMKIYTAFFTSLRIWSLKWKRSSTNKAARFYPDLAFPPKSPSSLASQTTYNHFFLSQSIIANVGGTVSCVSRHTLLTRLDASCSSSTIFQLNCDRSLSSLFYLQYSTATMPPSSPVACCLVQFSCCIGLYYPIIATR
jgi:hypothetical protein